MVYKNFRINCLVRVIVLAVTVFFFLYLLLNTALHVTTFILGVIIVLEIVSLIMFVEKTNRDLTRFLESIKYSDFSQSFSEGLGGKTFRELNEAFSAVVTEFQKARAEKEEQYRYLQTVVQHIGLGILSYDGQGEVDLLNTAAKRLLRVTHLNNIDDLGEHLTPLRQALKTIKAGEKVLVKIDLDGEIMTLAVYPTAFRMRERSIMLVSMQNIESELAEQEMEAWQKLIRVLTHEIMNSVTPIASLASTANDLINRAQPAEETEPVPLTAETTGDIRDALGTIEKRSQGLLHFIDAYRSLTRIPVPEFQIVPVRELLEQVTPLMREQLENNGIDLIIEVEPESLEVTADPDLIEQVLINLILNAVQVLHHAPEKKILLRSQLNEQDRVIITVTDNGPGISNEVKDKIFTPFFTTKKTGSGIGLSLARQIMRLHRGNISVVSVPDERTTFTLRF